MKKRIMGLLLSVVMLFSLLPVSAFANDADYVPNNKWTVSMNADNDAVQESDAYKQFKSSHKDEIKAIEAEISEGESGSYDITWTVPKYEGWKVTRVKFTIWAVVDDQLTSVTVTEDQYTLENNTDNDTITLTYSGDIGGITTEKSTEGDPGYVKLALYFAPSEEEETASVNYVNTFGGDANDHGYTEWQTGDFATTMPVTKLVYTGKSWEVPTVQEFSTSKHPYEYWTVTGTTVTADGTVLEMSEDRTVYIPAGTQTVTVTYTWQLFAVTNIIEPLERVVKQGENELTARTGVQPDTFIVAGQQDVMVDYTATMDMSKLDSGSFGAGSWDTLKNRWNLITDATVVNLNFTFDSNIILSEDDFRAAVLTSDMFTFTGTDPDAVAVEGNKVTLTCHWDEQKATQNMTSKGTLDPIIKLNGVTLKVKDDWTGDTLTLKNEGDVTGYVHTTLEEDGLYGAIYGGYQSDTFALTTQVTLSYDANGGEGSMGSQTYKVGENATVAPNGFTRSGYTFTGWNTQAGGNGTEYQAGYTIEMPANDVVLYAQWRQNYTVTYDLNNGTAKPDVDYTEQTVSAGSSVTVKDAPSRSGYTFAGWSDGTTVYRPGDELTVTQNITLTAQWDKDAPVITYVVLHYESNGGTVYRDESYAYGTTVKLDKIPTREGYTFTGWYADEALTERITSIKMTGNKTVYAGWAVDTVPDMLNGDDHFAYIIGYDDGTVRPNANITRAEAATIFFRLLKDEVRDGNLTDENDFSDVSEDAWYNKAVSTMSALGIVKGRTATTFAPDAYITRAELAAICARFDTGLTDGNSSFTDISGHWAEAEIERAAMLGWINGYPDGTFRPDQPITRAEAMTLINRVLCRIPEDEDDLLDGMNEWPDNQPGEWYYLAVQEATNSHDFKHKGEIYETWTKLTSEPDWTRYQ